MKKGFLFWFLMCFLFIGYSSEAKPLYAPNQVIVKFRPSTLSLQSFNLLLTQMGASEIYTSELLPELKVITFKNKSIDAVLTTLQSHPAVEYAEPNFILYLKDDGDDDDDDDDDNGKFPFPWPFPFPPPGDGEFPFPWPPGDGEFPWPWPPGDGGGDTPKDDPAPQLPPDPVTPSEDPDLNTSWGIGKTGAVNAWTTTVGSKDIIVGIVDTGIDYNHEDLITNVYRNPKEIPDNAIDDDNNGFIDDVIGWDFVHNDHLPYDDHMHGTHVAGTIGATGNNGIGVSGINQVVTLLSAKAFDASGSGAVETAIKAIEYVTAQGAKVINNSWGDSEFSQALEDILAAVTKKGVTVVCAAGNETNNNDKKAMYPANSASVISVAATTKADKLAFFSNYGKKTVHLAAPGAEIYSTVPGNKYDHLDGTSMASPHVAGAAALLLSLKPTLTPQEIKTVLMETVDKISTLSEKVVAGGRLNVEKAIEKLKK